MDYKELIEQLRFTQESNTSILLCLCADAATAIETLLAKRDAAVEELRGICWCCVNGKKWGKAPSWSKMTTCEHLKEQGILARGGGKSKCLYWKWRGPTMPDREQEDG